MIICPPYPTSSLLPAPCSLLPAPCSLLRDPLFPDPLFPCYNP
ncbi:hypothetical protein [Moorena sp. SIO4A5]|nr:hypothetical protein [Moorena sp. SIO4A5]